MKATRVLFSLIFVAASFANAEIRLGNFNGTYEPLSRDCGDHKVDHNMKISTAFGRLKVKGSPWTGMMGPLNFSTSLRSLNQKAELRAHFDNMFEGWWVAQREESSYDAATGTLMVTSTWYKDANLYTNNREQKFAPSSRDKFKFVLSPDLKKLSITSYNSNLVNGRFYDEGVAVCHYTRK